MSADTQTIRIAEVMACPHFILAPEHYRTDGHCRCGDPSHVEMATWGYRWSDDLGRWLGDEEED